MNGSEETTNLRNVKKFGLITLWSIFTLKRRQQMKDFKLTFPSLHKQLLDYKRKKLLKIINERNFS